MIGKAAERCDFSQTEQFWRTSAGQHRVAQSNFYLQIHQKMVDLQG